MKEFILFFFAMLTSLWLFMDMTAAIARTVKFGNGQDKYVTLRMILIPLCALFWALIYAL